MGEFLDLWFPSCHSPKLPSASSNSPLIILCRLPTPHHSECQEKKMSNWHHPWIWAPLHPLIMGRSDLTSGSWKFNSTNHRPGLGLIWELLNVSGPMSQIHYWCQLDIFFLLTFSMTRRNLPISLPLTNDRYSTEAKKKPKKGTIIAGFEVSR